MSQRLTFSDNSCKVAAQAKSMRVFYQYLMRFTTMSDQLITILESLVTGALVASVPLMLALWTMQGPRDHRIG